MELQSLLLRYPHIRLANNEDNLRILEFYNTFSLSKGQDSIQYQRGNDFFSFLRERSAQNITFLLEDDSSKMQGIAVVSYRKGFIAGELTNIGYVGDLRITLNRKLIREWRAMLSDFFEFTSVMKETNYCKHYFTAFITSNAHSRVNLINTKIKNICFTEYAPYKMFNIIGAFLPPIKTKYNISHASESDLELIKSFLHNNHKSLQFGHDQFSEVERKIKELNNFSISNFLLIKNENDIQAITHTWNPKRTKQVITNNVPVIFKIIHKLATFIPFLMMKPLPKEHIPLDILYLSHITYAPSVNQSQKETILKEICRHIFKTNDYKFNILAYADFQTGGTLKTPSGLIMQKIPMSLNTVHYKDNNQHIHFPIKQKPTPPFFEMEFI